MVEDAEIVDSAAEAPAIAEDGAAEDATEPPETAAQDGQETSEATGPDDGDGTEAAAAGDGSDAGAEADGEDVAAAADRVETPFGESDVAAAVADGETADGAEQETIVGPEIAPEATGDAATAEPAVESAPTMAVAAPPPPEPQRRSAFSLVLGGIIAAGLGAGALYYSTERGWIDLSGAQTNELRTALDTQAAEIVALKEALQSASGEIEALKSAQPDLSPVTGALDGVASDVAGVSDQVAALTARLDDTDARLADVETQPIPEAELPAEVVAAYERQLAEMQGAIDARFGEMEAAQDDKLAGIETTLTGKLTEIEAAQISAMEAEAAAAASAKAAEARAALAELEVALDTGGEFATALAALSEVTGTDAPADLADHAETGIATLQNLKDGFPPAARDALAVSIQPDPEAGATGRLGAFFRRQLGVRSLEPRAGDDPDAVLSRAEAALAENDIAGARDLIGSLPEAGQAAFADWIAAAETRQAALEAAQVIANEINSN